MPNLIGMDLVGWNVAEADLSRANLYRANLSDTSFVHANLSETHLLDANLSRAVLIEADLSGTDLYKANLSGANLRRANLREANLSLANLNATIFDDTDLTDASGLEACVHEGPSMLDHLTLTKTGRLPLSFLRGAGLPDTLIEYLPSILEEAIQFYSCFISYSTRDQSFAERLYADLQSKGVRCWFAPHDIPGGKKIHEQIDAAIRVHERLLLILSPASMDSEWVRTEIAKARKLEKQEDRRMLFPVRLVDFETLRQWECFDGDTGKDSASEIREYYVPDFSNWTDDDSYKKEFDKLLRDLKVQQRNHR